jgi:hypothetical protein
MIEDQRFKSMRHIEAVRNHIDVCIVELMDRAQQHDQSKLQPPEREAFDICTPLLRGLTYGSAEYKTILNKMKPAIDHHQGVNRHHPEFFANGIGGMNLIDLTEMVCDWRAACMRHENGNPYISLKINIERFGLSDQLAGIIENTLRWFDTRLILHWANES